MKKREHSTFNDYEVGELVRVISEGPIKGAVGTITSISPGWMGGPSNLTLSFRRNGPNMIPYCYIVEKSATEVEPT